MLSEALVPLENSGKQVRQPAVLNMNGVAWNWPFCCRHSGRVWDGFAFHGRYEGLLRELVLGFKFSARLGQGRLLAGFLAEAWQRAAGRLGPGSMDAGAPDCLVEAGATAYFDEDA